jgi:acyl carrier protein
MNPEFEQILRTHLPFLPPDEPLAADTDLADQGLDSLGIVDLLTLLEGRYEVTFVDDALTRETFRTPGSLWSVLCGLRAVPA